VLNILYTEHELNILDMLDIQEHQPLKTVAIFTKTGRFFNRPSTTENNLGIAKKMNVFIAAY